MNCLFLVLMLKYFLVINMLKILKINKGIIYVVLGIIVLIFRASILNYLYLFVSIPVLVIALEELAYGIYVKSYKNQFNDLGEILLKIVLSVFLLLYNKEEELLEVCVLWGIIVIISATMAINKAIYELNHKKITVFLFETTISVAQIVFSILLLIDPYEHVNFHIILLGIEMLLIGTKEFLSYIYFKFKNVLHKNNIINELSDTITKLDEAEFELLKSALKVKGNVTIDKEEITQNKAGDK